MIYVILILIVLSPALVGAVVGLTGLIPPLRRAARANRLRRKLHAAAGALVAFVGMYVLATVIMVTVMVGVAIFYGRLERSALYVNPPGDSTLTAEGRARFDAAQTEMLVRQLNPLPGPACYTTAEACELADYVAGIGGSGGAPGGRMSPLGTLPYIAGFGLISAIIAATLIFRLTRREQTASPSEIVA